MGSTFERQQDRDHVDRGQLAGRRSHYHGESERRHLEGSSRRGRQDEDRSINTKRRDYSSNHTRRRSRSRSADYASNWRSRSPLNHAQDSERRRRLDYPDRRQSDSRSPSASRIRSPKPSRPTHDDRLQARPARSKSSVLSQSGIHSPKNSVSTAHVNTPATREVAASENRSIYRSQDKLNRQQVETRSKSDSPDQSSQPKDEMNFQPSGKLAAETKTYQGVVLKYHEPPEARKPSKKWRLYVFKLEKEVDLFHIHNQSAYLFGRDRIVVDVPIDHPSSSKQHAVIQYRQVSSTNEFGESKTSVKPFIIDLESANGTFVNQEKIPVSRYYELQSGDVIKFGFSTREYVLIPET